MKNALTNYFFAILGAVTLVIGLIYVPETGLIFDRILLIFWLEVMIFFNWYAFFLLFRSNIGNGYFSFLPSLIVALISVSLLSASFLIYQTAARGIESAMTWSFQTITISICIFILLVARKITHKPVDQSVLIPANKSEAIDIIDELIAKSDSLGIDRVHLRGVRDYLRYDLKFTEETRDHDTWKIFNQELRKISKSKTPTLDVLNEVCQNLRRL